MDNVGIVVESLDDVISFFIELGLTLEGRAMVEGEWAGRVTLRDFVLLCLTSVIPRMDLPWFRGYRASMADSLSDTCCQILQVLRCLSIYRVDEGEPYGCLRVERTRNQSARAALLQAHGVQDGNA